MLADLERREVEAERRELPTELRDLAPRDAAEAIRDERVADLGELRVELGRRAVPAGQWRGLADQRRAGPAQPLGDEPEALAIRLVREAATQLAVRLGQVLRVAGEARGEHAVQRHARGGGGDRLHQPRGDRLVATQHVVGVDAQRLLGDLRGHARVAVAVAADPAPEAQVRPDARWSRPGPAGVRGRGRGATGRRIERGIQRPVETWDHREQRGVEERHRGADLVEWRRAHDAQVGGPPQERDLLPQPAADLAVLGRGESRVVEPGEQDGAAPERHQHRAAAGLGRVRGQDRVDGEAAKELIQLGIPPAPSPQPRDRVRHRIVEDAVASRPFAAPQGAHPAARLGQVDEAEVECERADDRLGRAKIEGAQRLVEPFPLDRIVGPAQRDRVTPDPLHPGEQLGAGLFRDDLPEQCTEQPDLDRQRVPRTCRPDPERFRGDGGRCSRSRRRRLPGHPPGPFRARAATGPQPSGSQPFRRLVSCCP